MPQPFRLSTTVIGEVSHQDGIDELWLFAPCSSVCVCSLVSQDVEWHTTAHIEPDEYYANVGVRWPVNSIANSVSKVSRFARSHEQTLHESSASSHHAHVGR